MIIARLIAHIGFFGVGSAIGICIGLALLLAYHRKVRQIRVQGRKLLAIELRLESAWQNARVVSRVIRPGPGLSGVFVGGLKTGINGRVLSMRPLEESIQQSELSCDI